MTDILPDTETCDPIYLSNVKYWFTKYITYPCRGLLATHNAQD